MRSIVNLLAALVLCLGASLFGLQGSAQAGSLEASAFASPPKLSSELPAIAPKGQPIEAYVRCWRTYWGWHCRRFFWARPYRRWHYWHRPYWHRWHYWHRPYWRRYGWHRWHHWRRW